MTLLAGLDINASRARAVVGPSRSPQPLVLDAESGPELPLVLNLEGRRVETGIAGVQLSRRCPHLVCDGFLPHLGGDRVWTAGRHHLTAGQAMTQVFKRIQPSLGDVAGVALVLPSYLSRNQRNHVAELAKQAKLPLLGTVAAPLAASWIARAHRPWHGTAIVLDGDHHALVWSAVTVDETSSTPQAHIVGERTAARLGARVWKERLLNGVADRCIRQTRRDPRANALAEQMLYEQLEPAMEACRRGQLVEVAIQSESYYQSMVLQPGEMSHYCAPLVREAINELRHLLSTLALDRPPAMLIATASAARLPGLAQTLHEQSGHQTAVVALEPTALPQAAHELAARFFDGTLPRGPIDTAIPVKAVIRPRVQPVRTPSPSQQTRLPVRKSVEKSVRSDDDFSVGIDE
jgi:hypothetical protein